MTTEGPLEVLETLLRSRVVADYVEGLVQDALARCWDRLSPAERAALRAYLYDQLTADPVLRGLVSRIGRALKARKRGRPPAAFLGPVRRGRV